MGWIQHFGGEIQFASHGTYECAKFKEECKSFWEVQVS